MGSENLGNDLDQNLGRTEFVDDSHTFRGNGCDDVGDQRGFDINVPLGAK